MEIKITAQALADKLTMAGLEVTSLEEKGGDFVFEIEVTSNRPDCLSVIGIAREVAAITGKKLVTNPSVVSCQLPVVRKRKDLIEYQIRIEDKKDCSLYTAKIIKGVKVGPSPDWLRKRLELIGCRSINNIVDITNYILFTYGEPLHAFDLDKLISGAIFVRRARNGERITTIDAEQRMLGEDILVIADKNNPVAIAGIMGGLDSEVTESTRNILLEAAVFNPVLVRRGGQKLGLHSDSAYRFERGVSFETAEFASWQALELIQNLAGGECVLAKSSWKAKSKAKSINFTISGVEKILGVNIAPLKIKKILNSLEFQTKSKGKNSLLVKVPPHRLDVGSEIDLIEEIARVFGYDNIPKSLSAVSPRIDRPDTIALIKGILVGLGLNEVVTYSLIDRGLLRAFNIDDSGCVEILNPLSSEQEILRPTIIPSLCKVVAYNLNQKQEKISIFEIAKAFSCDDGKAPVEGLVLGIALCGMRPLLLESGLIRDRLGLLHLKGILEIVLERLGIKDYNFVSSRDNSCAITIEVNKEKIGSMMRLKQSVLTSLEIKNKDVFTAELCLDKIVRHSNLNKRFIALPAYPGISRDISFILKEGVSIADILNSIRKQAAPSLKDVKVTDYYKGKQIPVGFKGLTISCFYCSDERTLTEAEINPAHSRISDILKNEFGANIR